MVQSSFNGWFFPTYMVEHLCSTLFVVEEVSGELHTADVSDCLIESEWTTPQDASNRWKYFLA